MNPGETIGTLPDRGVRSLRASTDLVAYTGHALIHAPEFNEMIMGVQRHVAPRPEQRWALVCRDTLSFATGFLGLLQAGKTVILPQTDQPSAVEVAQAGAVLTDDPVRFDGFTTVEITAAVCRREPVSGCPALDEQSRIELYTSGSTGRPKRVDKRLGQLHAEVAELEGKWGQVIGDAVVVATVPHHHLYGLLFRFLWPWWSRRPMYTPTCLQPFQLAEAIRQFDRCVVVSCPAIVTRVTEVETLRGRDSFAGLFSSGAPLPPDTAIRLASGLGQAVTEVYGSTETGGVAWRARREPADVLSWHQFSSVETRILNPDHNAQGRLLVRSPWTPSEEWVDTGDLAQCVPMGGFLLCGRADSVYKVEDKRLSITEMEERLGTHALVEEARVVILEGKRTSVGAVVVLNAAGRDLLAQDGIQSLRLTLVNWLRAWYDPVLIPRKWRFVPVMPGNGLGKIEKARLLELFAKAN